MDLRHWADIALIGGMVFAVLELIHSRRSRREANTIALVSAFERPQFARALSRVLSLPEGQSAAELRARGEETEEAAVLVSLTIESIAVMCRRDIVDVDVV